MLKFEYDKNLNILNASGNVKISDNLNNQLIYTDKIVYKKMKTNFYWVILKP